MAHSDYILKFISAENKECLKKNEYWIITEYHSMGSMATYLKVCLKICFSSYLSSPSCLSSPSTCLDHQPPLLLSWPSHPIHIYSPCAPSPHLSSTPPYTIFRATPSPGIRCWNLLWLLPEVWLTFTPSTATSPVSYIETLSLTTFSSELMERLASATLDWLKYFAHFKMPRIAKCRLNKFIFVFIKCSFIDILIYYTVIYCVIGISLMNIVLWLKCIF